MYVGFAGNKRKDAIQGKIALLHRSWMWIRDYRSSTSNRPLPGAIAAEGVAENKFSKSISTRTVFPGGIMQISFDETLETHSQG